MTGHQINSLVGDLVAMAQAMERLPQVERERDEWMEKANEHLLTLIDRDKDLDQARSYAATLEQKVRDAEVAKDAAETMFLEADERTSRALDFIKATFGNAGSLIQALEPPKPEPVVESKPIEAGESGVHFEQELHPSHFEAGVQGQSESPPTQAAPISDVQPGPVATTEDASASSSIHEAPTSWAGPASIDTPPPTVAKPYEGLNYFDHPTYIPLDQWLAGGGTEDNYNWRPAPQRPLGSF